MISIRPNSLNWPIKLTICVGIGAIPSIAVLFYLTKIKKYKKEEYEAIDEILNLNQKVIEIKIPGDCVRSIIGSQGCVIKEIQRKTNTRIHFKDKTDGQSSRQNKNEKQEVNKENMLIIRGASFNVGLAELEIKKIILDQPIVLTEDYFVPEYACGRIIGRQGVSIKEMQNFSNCRIKLNDRLPKSELQQWETPNSSSASAMQVSQELYAGEKNDNNNTSRKVITLIGGIEQIASAKELILAKIREEDAFREKKQKRERHVYSDNNIVKTKTISSSESNLKSENSNSSISLNTAKSPPDLFNIDNYLNTDKTVNVFCTAVANPFAFWVQIDDENLTDLNKLKKNMFDFYSKNAFSNEYLINNINEIKVGQMVANECFKGQWFRAEVKEIFHDTNEVDLYFVDQGDSKYSSLRELRILKKDFYSLPQQATMCSLADIEINNKNNEWCEEDIVLFEKLVDNGNYKKLQLELLGFKIDSNSEKKLQVKLLDKSKNCYISDLLIQNGCAVKT